MGVRWLIQDFSCMELRDHHLLKLKDKTYAVINGYLIAPGGCPVTLQVRSMTELLFPS